MSRLLRKTRKTEKEKIFRLLEKPSRFKVTAPKMVAHP